MSRTITKKTLEQEIADVREAYGATEEQLAAAHDRETALGEALEANARRETSVALGECTAEEVAAERQTLLVEQRNAEEEVRRLTAASAGMAPRMEDLKNTLAMRDLAHLEEVYLEAVADRDKDAERIYVALTPALEAFRDLQASRAAVDLAFGAFREASPSSVRFADEPEWRPDGIEQLIAGLLEGPRTPTAARERESERAAEKQREAEQRQIDWAAGYVADAATSDALEYVLGQIGEQHRAQVVRKVRELRRQRLEEFARISASMREAARVDASPTALEELAEAEAADEADIARRLAELDDPTGHAGGDEATQRPADSDAETAALLEVAQGNAEFLP